MHYYIDGYNLLFRFLRKNEDLSTQRERLIAELKKKIDALHIEATLVFDAPRQAGWGSRYRSRYLEIRFTDEGQTADEYIISSLAEKTFPSRHTVVTSDKKLAWSARQRQAKTETAEEFAFWLERRYQNKAKKRKEKKPPLLSRAPPLMPDAQPSMPLQGSLEFYRIQFETAFLSHQENLPPLKPSPLAKEKRIKKKTPKTSKKSSKPPKNRVSSSQEWLDAFQRDLDAEEKYPF